MNSLERKIETSKSAYANLTEAFEKYKRNVAINQAMDELAETLTERLSKLEERDVISVMDLFEDTILEDRFNNPELYWLKGVSNEITNSNRTNI